MPEIYQSTEADAIWPREFCSPTAAISIGNEVQKQCCMWQTLYMPDTSVTGTIERLRRLYIFRNEQAVRKFAESNPLVVIGLLLAANAVPTYFPDAQLALDVYPDPEQPDYVLLAFRIMTKSRYPHTREQLKRFRRDWWYAHVTEAINEKIALGVEPV